MWPLVIGWALNVLPVIPSLVTDVENLWRGHPKAGAQKAATTHNILHPSITNVAQAIATAPGCPLSEGEIARALAAYAQTVSDATVALANKLQVFPHSAPAAAGAPVVPVKPLP
jgi:hypothetical protein